MPWRATPHRHKINTQIIAPLIDANERLACSDFLDSTGEKKPAKARA